MTDYQAMVCRIHKENNTCDKCEYRLKNGLCVKNAEYNVATSKWVRKSGA